ncbi:MAG: alanine racemase [Candidatus Omnitrophica bacterium]|nr:alanine racemase [Candidatus Omnitrophota bacterium]MBU0878586.1 alanine racemase [Candidatus Omnitrophota bacterium]MBU0896338.1 alanine racemase [Candidatus Omnitrophota bacterium]MBU1134266.1 alanine racemase [Candidatus Omnitrophota bacterium]MBU1523974.1 alanine racemase [Candidatus Omnitrophota bacterium]
MMIRPLWIEINLKALRNNFKRVKNLVGRNIKVIATVKQSAYGHGLIPIARELSVLGVDFFGVGSVEEAVLLRENGFKEPILVLTAVLKGFANYFIQYNLTPTVVDIKFAKEVNKQAAKKGMIFPVHIKIDTGMGRLGPYYKDAYEFIKQIRRFKNIFLEGIYTHMPCVDTDPSFTNYQISIFNEFILKLKKENIQFKFQHCANSMGIANFPNSHFNMVRPGLILYGIKPSPRIDLEVNPVLSLKSRIIFLKSIKKGMGISYGRTYIVKKTTRIGTAAIGYADGYPWALSNVASVIIKNSFFSLVGRVCMDHIMVNLGNRGDIKVEDEVILIGRRKDLQITVQDLASRAKTIPYEIISRLSPKIPRIYKYPFSEVKDPP